MFKKRVFLLLITVLLSSCLIDRAEEPSFHDPVLEQLAREAINRPSGRVSRWKLTQVKTLTYGKN